MTELPEISTLTRSTKALPWPKRLYSLDVSRGFAALAVVLWHWQHFAFIGTGLPQGYDRTTQPWYPVLKLFYEKGWMGVEYFFLLSGFIFFWLYRSSIDNRSTSFADFWVYRFSRLYPLHFVTLLLVAFLQAVFINRNGNSFVYASNDAYHFLLNLGFASSWGLERGLSFNGPVWSVSIEILLYCIFFIVAYLHWGGARFCAGFTVLTFPIMQFAPRPVLSYGLPLFFWGGFVYYSTLLITTKLQKLKTIVYAVAVLSWLLTIINVYLVDISSFILRAGFPGEVVLDGFLVFCLFPFTVCSLALIEIDRGQFLKPVAWVGDITYASYLLHFPLQVVLALAVSYGTLSRNFYLNPLSLVAFYSILIPLSYLTYTKFERPMQTLIRNRMHKKAG